ncbi:alpha/beta hydrolase [Blastococcus jejuensis]|uniref:Alpha/beta hydrolase n=1 Tax=Blastococcus jejuensis TaxID=351224 RepID=A0ABP6NXK7_9ACTN
MDEVEVEGLRIAYRRAGHGPPLVLVHGFVGDASSTWGGQLEALSDEFTVVAWDGPGAGGSADPPDWFRLPQFAECLAGFVAELGLEHPHVAGLSFGGAMALELYRGHPGLPRTLVLAGAYAGWAGSLPPETVAERLRFCLDVADLPPDDFVEAMLPSMFSRSAAPERVTAFSASMRQFHPDGFRAMARASAEADLRSVLGRVSVPALVLCGDQDARAPLPVAETLHAAIPGSELVVLDGVGHVSAVEAPELFNAAVRTFLRRSGP